MLWLWNKLIIMDDSRLRKNIFKWNKQLKPGWRQNVYDVFRSLNCEDLFIENHIIDLNFVRSTLHEFYCNNWINTIACVPKIRIYTLYKDEYLTEPYVEYVVNRAHRSALAKFRYGILPRSVETGSFNVIPLEFRLCVFCDDNVVEDEYHFFFSCNLYNDLRSSLFDYLRQDVTDFDTLHLNDIMIYLMSHNMIKKTCWICIPCHGNET